MNRSSLLTVSMFALLGVFLGTPSAQAGNNCPVFCSADRYREAVVDFERHVQRVRYVARCDERLVDDLEDSTSRLRSAARQLSRTDRLCQRFAETDALHRQVEAVFFGSGVYPPDPRLEACWVAVVRSYEALAFEFNQLPCYRAYRTRNGGCAPNLRTLRTPIRTVPTLGPQFDQRPFFTNPVGDIPFGLTIDNGRIGVVPSVTPSNYRQPTPFDRDASMPPQFSRRTIQDMEQLRNAVIGAMLQRR
ncbi:MAG: hypothetical protein AAF802_25030 [Planctomycetota bacterium]